MDFDCLHDYIEKLERVYKQSENEDFDDIVRASIRKQVIRELETLVNKCLDLQTKLCDENIKIKMPEEPKQILAVEEPKQEKIEKVEKAEKVSPIPSTIRHVRSSDKLTRL